MLLWKTLVVALYASGVSSLALRDGAAARPVNAATEVHQSASPPANAEVKTFSSRSVLEKRLSFSSWPDYSSIVANFFTSYYTFMYVVNGVFYNVDLHNDPDHLKLRGIVETALGSGFYYSLLYDVYKPDSAADSPFAKGKAVRQTVESYKQLRDWFRLTSAVFASQCSGAVYLVWDGVTPFTGKSRDGSGRPWAAIWVTDEFPEILKTTSKVTAVYLIDPVTQTVGNLPYWVKGQVVPKAWQYTPPDIPPLGVGGGATRKRSYGEQDFDLPDDWEAQRDAHLARIRLFQGQSSNSTGSHPATEIDETVRSENGLKPRAGVTRPPPGINGYIQARPERTIFSNADRLGWDSGQCSFHWTQGKVNGDGPPLRSLGQTGYPFGISLFDDGKCDIIGHVTRQSIPWWDQNAYALDSRLPYTLVVTPGMLPQSPVQFKYANLTFYSNDPSYCGTGGYTPDPIAGVRTGDCWFPCNPYQ